MSKTKMAKFALMPAFAVSLIACGGGGNTPTPTPDPGDGKVQVTFKNYDGTVLQDERIEKGTDAVFDKEKYSAFPSKSKQGEEAANVFTGWDKELKNITSDTVFTAQFKKIDKWIDKDHDGIPEGVDTDNDSNYFEVGAKSMVYLDQNITIDFSKFLKQDANMEYDNEIAKLGLFLSNPKIDFKDGLFNDNSYGGRENAMYARLGCDEWKHFDFKDLAAKEYTYDKWDTTSGCVAHKYLYDDEGNIVKDLIIIAFEGTNGKNRWASNFDVGYWGDDYWDKVGDATQHPEWDEGHKDYHKGFYVAAKRVLEDEVDGSEKREGPVRFLKYIKDHSTKSDGNPIVFVTGHSRGGAMATLVGDYLATDYQNAENKCTPFTYAFASPAAWGGGTTKRETPTVFNIINSDDLVTMVPFSEWGFSRIGNDIVSESVFEKYKDLYNANRDKREYQRIENAGSILHNVGCENRDEIYNFKVAGDATRYMSNIALNDDYLTGEEADALIDKLKADYGPEGEHDLGNFSKFINFEKYEIYEDNYNVYANCCLGTLTALVQYAMTNDSKVINNIAEIVPMISNSKFLELALSIGINIAAGGGDTVALPHDYGAYHIILREYKGK